ncbi:MAG: hypothetical protein ACRCYU_22760, partial [Nocardioides sp.]
LLSSHLLNEVELIADQMILIGNGRIVASGDKESLLRGTQSQTLVTSLDNATLGQTLAAAQIQWQPAGGGLRVEAEPVQVGAVAAEHRIVLTDLRPAEGGLEDLFLTLTAETQRDAATASATPIDPAISAPAAPALQGANQ